MPDSGTPRLASLLVRTQTNAGPSAAFARSSAAGSPSIASTHSPRQPSPSATLCQWTTPIPVPNVLP